MLRSSEAIRLFMYGIGSMGQGISRLAVHRSGLRIVAAADIDPLLSGRDLGDVLNVGRQLGVTVAADAAQALRTSNAQVAVHTTTATLQAVFPQIMQCIEAGCHVVSTTEELTYPFINPQATLLAQKINEAAIARGVVVLGVGLNPGYIMDALPIMLSASCVDVTRVHLRRIVDASRLWNPLPPHLGAGLDIANFIEQAQHRRIGHIGLSQSLALIASAFHWQLDSQPNIVAQQEPKPGKFIHAQGSIIEILEPIIAHHHVTVGSTTVEAGQVAGVRQIALGWVNKTEVLRLDLDMYVGAPYPQDEIEIEATPAIRVTIPGGLNDEIATIGLALNAIEAVVERAASAPGLVTVADLTPLHFRPYIKYG